MTTTHGESETGILRCFGQMLRLLRTSRGLTRAELGARLSYGEDMVASVELGRRIPKPEFIERADAVLEAGGLLTVMKEEVARARYPAFFRDAAKLEAEAVELHVYANQAVPGLLQTEEYARAVFDARRPLLDETVISERVAARLARQEIFDRKPLPTISFVIEESVLRRPIGGWSVWRGQLKEICLRGRSRNVEVQIMPTEVSEHAALAGPFTLIETARGQRIAYVEVQKESRLLLERASVREHEEQYGILRAQALTPRESLQLVEKLLGREMNAVDEARANGELVWRKSTYSSGEGGECVEVAVAGGFVHVRDSKQMAESGPELRVGSVAWTATLRAI